MSWLQIISPLIVAILIFIAYLGGKSAGRKEAELKQVKKEQEESDEVNAIIDSNNMLDLHRADMWLQERAKK
jgi:hypothetical protein